MRLKEIHTELIKFKNSFLETNDWEYVRKSLEIIEDFENIYKNEHSEYAGYSENLIRIKNSILMTDRNTAEFQFIHGMTSITDIILR